MKHKAWWRVPSTVATFTYTMQEMDQVFAGEEEGLSTRVTQPDDRRTRRGDARRRRRRDRLRLRDRHGCRPRCPSCLRSEIRFNCSGVAGSLRRDYNLLNTILINFGVKTFFVDFSDLAAVRDKAREIKPQVLIAETISNPLLKVCDIEACAGIAHEMARA